jgi:hypothetical protein
MKIGPIDKERDLVGGGGHAVLPPGRPIISFKVQKSKEQ